MTPKNSKVKQTKNQFFKFKQSTPTHIFPTTIHDHHHYYYYHGQTTTLYVRLYNKIFPFMSNQYIHTNIYKQIEKREAILIGEWKMEMKSSSSSLLVDGGGVWWSWNISNEMKRDGGEGKKGIKGYWQKKIKIKTKN